ncbi:hypothetical protein J4Q44_G00020920 [Coregonus suidteri]|uniref:Uncharacterized protein n=1 Tax=Coregonus suidteri TaxID=861788 RepID=A0AAN8MJ78_9TELE
MGHTVWYTTPVKGPATGRYYRRDHWGVLLLAIIGSVVVMVRKKRNQNNGDGPPKHKPPPPKKQQTISSSTDRLNTSRDPVESEDGPVDHLYYAPQNGEPSTDLDAYSDEEYNRDAEELYYADAPSAGMSPG